ncbi:uncharacterized protein LOC127812193 isoform X2 [Diospyros lotus]|uniref:uncharacterized protein LOC127812193 isoform X2 n=1 Tax=Diospyros lotus TaxID=55363 RepID=UPI0022533BF1|nr:uncharacterized protein LOC127812193 isoform X2 [Diospyros lotus]
MLLAHWQIGSLYCSSPKFGANHGCPLSSSLSNKFIAPLSHTKFKYFPKCASKCSCVKDAQTAKPRASEGFLALERDVPWDSGSVWSTMALYLFSLHIPLSFGGLSVVSYLLHRPTLDAQTEAMSLLAIQAIELYAVFWLLKCIAKPEYKLTDFFETKNLSKERSWWLAAVLGFVLLMLLVFFSSFLMDQLNGPKDTNSPILKEILSSGLFSRTACILVYCIITPLLEEIVYRGFLLTSLTSRMKWHQAVVTSSAVFSVAHFSDFFLSEVGLRLIVTRRNIINTLRVEWIIQFLLLVLCYWV